MLKSLQIEPEKCTGCLQCEMACSYQAEGAFNPSASRIKIFPFHQEGRFVPYTCTQCAEAWCMHACPVEAIVINEDTAVKFPMQVEQMKPSMLAYTVDQFVSYLSLLIS